LLVQTTTSNASQEFATKLVKSSEEKTTATNVRCAHQDMSQTPQEANALESSQNADVPKFMTAVDTFASHAHHIKLPPAETRFVSQDNAQVSTKFLVLLINAINAKSARKDPLQTTSEEDASDTSLLNAHATRDSMTLDSDVSIAQQVLDHLLTTEAASALIVTKIKS
jgi:hypothetical protein